MKDYAGRARTAAKVAAEGSIDTVESAWQETQEAWQKVKSAAEETWAQDKSRFLGAMDRLEARGDQSGSGR